MNASGGTVGWDYGSIPAWLTFAVAFVGTILALRQFWLARKLQDQQLQIALANLLLSIDGEFEGAEIAASRKAVRALRNRMEAKFALSKAKNKSPDAERAAVAEEFSHVLNEMWRRVREFDDQEIENAQSGIKEEMDRYYELMALPNWMETVGMLCTRNLIRTDDVLTLYAGVVITTLHNFRIHIETRRVEGPHPSARFFENAYLLYDEAVSYRKRRDDPPTHRPLRSRLGWS